MNSRTPRRAAFSAAAKKRLRSSRERLGTAGFVLAIAALVFAMFGGAYAASSDSGDKASASKGKRGPKGPKGAKGAKGATGPAGPAGPAGAAGRDGAQGPQGAPGQNGKSVVVTAIPPEEEDCEELGGVEVKREGDAVGTEVCTGSPWPAGGLLPEGATETGIFANPDPTPVNDFFGWLGEGESYVTTISFSLPLILAPDLVVVPGTETGYGSAAGNGCPGVSGGVPQAASGKLCLYIGQTVGDASVTAYSVENGAELGPGPDPTGALLKFSCPNVLGEPCSGAGTWAVTG